MTSNICPFCKEKIKNNATVCKHCNKDLTKFREEEKSKNKKQNKRVWKIIGWLIVIGIGIAMWYIAIPAVSIWFIWKKTKWSKRNKWIGTGSVFLLLIIFASIASYNSKPPVLTISEPSDNYSVQAKTIAIKGNVSPSGSNVSVNNKPIDVEGNGSFNYEVALDDMNNIFLIKATHGGKTAQQKLNINRIFTAEEQIAYDQQKAAEEQAKQDKAAQNQADKLEQDKALLQRELDSFNKSFDSSVYRGSADALTLEVVLFKAWAQIIEEHENSSDSELQSMAKQLKQKVSQLQVKEFPLMRKNYADVMAKLVWEENIDVKALGGAYDTLDLEGGIFIDNKSIAKIQGTIKESVELFRFSRVNYKWSQYAEYTYYDIDSPADSEVTSR